MTAPNREDIDAVVRYLTEFLGKLGLQPENLKAVDSASAAT